MKELSIEEKAKAYDEAIERARELHDKWIDEDGKDVALMIFPELKESESEDERIRKEIIAFITTTPKARNSHKKWIAWLEKQGKNNMGISENTKQKLEDNLNKALEKETPESWNEFLDGGEQKLDTYFSDLRTWKYIVDYVVTKWCGIGQYLDNPRLTTIAEELQKKYYLEQKKGEQILANSAKTCKDEQKPIDKIQMGKKYKCIASPRYSTFFRGEIYKPEDEFLCSLMNFCSDCFEPIEDGEQNLADKVEPKFKVGDWIVRNGKTFQILHIDKVLDGTFHYWFTVGTWLSSANMEDAHLWTIQDAKDGDVLVVDNVIFIYKRTLASHIVSYCKLINDTFEPNEYARTCCEGNTYIHPATKEQRNTLMKAMADAGYTFDFDKKELKKIKHKRICKLDNSYTCVKFPFKAKVKSSGAIVTIHGGQLSHDGKEWIEYQSDVEDGYKVYDPNNLELVCEIEQNPTWNIVDETIFTNIIIMLKEGASLHFNKKDITKAIDWLKSFKERYTWKPSDEQMHYLHWVANIKLGDSVVEQEVSKHLNGLLEDLKKLREE